MYQKRIPLKHLKEVVDMKSEKTKSNRMRLIAAVCAVVVVAGSTAGIYVFRSNSHAQNEEKESPAVSTVSAKDDSSISAGGTVTSSTLADSLGMQDTAIRLTVEEVLAEAGDIVEVGTPLYLINTESLEKAEKTLKNELSSAEDALKKEKASYQLDKSKAYILYQSELLLGDSAQITYNSGIDSLDRKLKEAYESYKEALDIINNTPSEIATKEARLTSEQYVADSIQEKKSETEKALNEAQEEYTAAVGRYNNIVSEYNASAGVVRYLGKTLGKDTSFIVLEQTVSSELKGQNSSSSDMGMQDMAGTDGDMPAFDYSQGLSFSGRVSINSDESAENEETDAASTYITELYQTALGEYKEQKDELLKAQREFITAEEEYRTLSGELSEITSELKTAQNEVSSLEKEISSLNSSLSKAKSNLSKLKSEYNSLSSSYSTSQLKLKKTLDTDTAACENAEYHYKITCSTLDEELETAQNAYDTAEENLRIFEESLSDGYICAQQDGTIYSLSSQAGRSVDVSSPFAYYVDENSFETIVELDQNDVTHISIGDSVLIYSSETGITNGKVTAIAAGEATSLADVRFNVTVTADDNSSLYSGESVNVYFNADNMSKGDFADFKGGSESRESGLEDGRPDFSNGFPGGFDPSNMPSFDRRKDD